MKHYKNLFLIFTIFILLNTIFINIVLADLDESNHNGFEKGISWKPLVPMKKITFIEHDEDSLLDDYSYLASVPSSVFYDKNNERIFSNPLLFFESKDISLEEKELTLDTYEGIKYFMEDFMSYSNGNLDQMILVNVPITKLELDWKAKDRVTIEGNNPYNIASEIALQDWSYSNNAVVAVIDEDFKRLDNKVRGKVEGKISIDKTS